MITYFVQRASKDFGKERHFVHPCNFWKSNIELKIGALNLVMDEWTIKVGGSWVYKSNLWGVKEMENVLEVGPKKQFMESEGHREMPWG